jgi:hypothetical protein
MLCACGAIAALHLAAVAAGDAMAAHRWTATIASACGPSSAGAQHWGVARRTARRTTRTPVRRAAYLYPAAVPAAAAATVAATTAAADRCYITGRRRWCPRMVAGEVVYVAID